MKPKTAAAAPPPVAAPSAGKRSATGKRSAGKSSSAGKRSAPRFSAKTLFAPDIVPAPPYPPIPPENPFVDPCTDTGFKRLFGREATKDLLIAFLNSILPADLHIEDLKFINTDLPGDARHLKGIVFDIYCTNERGEHFIVEMQVRDEGDFIECTLAYVAQNKRSRNKSKRSRSRPRSQSPSRGRSQGKSRTRSPSPRQAT
jgi:hypothetical protein